MVKKILGSLLVVAIVAVAAFNVNMNTQESEMSLLALANVEALATPEKENPGGPPATSKKYNCYSILEGSGQAVSCSTCEMYTGTPPWYHFGNSCTR